jgi:hypothetical protein
MVEHGVHGSSGVGVGVGRHELDDDGRVNDCQVRLLLPVFDDEPAGTPPTGATSMPSRHALTAATHSLRLRPTSPDSRGAGTGFEAQCCSAISG